ncbi:hypothetical protein Agub_g10260, partial [Astrephomene gubernaculifera]
TASTAGAGTAVALEREVAPGVEAAGAGEAAAGPVGNDGSASPSDDDGEVAVQRLLAAMHTDSCSTSTASGDAAAAGESVGADEGAMSGGLPVRHGVRTQLLARPAAAHEPLPNFMMRSPPSGAAAGGRGAGDVFTTPPSLRRMRHRIVTARKTPGEPAVAARAAAAATGGAAGAAAPADEYELHSMTVSRASSEYRSACSSQEGAEGGATGPGGGEGGPGSDKEEVEEAAEAFGTAPEELASGEGNAQPDGESGQSPPPPDEETEEQPQQVPELELPELEEEQERRQEPADDGVPQPQQQQQQGGAAAHAAAQEAAQPPRPVDAAAAVPFVRLHGARASMQGALHPSWYALAEEEEESGGSAAGRDRAPTDGGSQGEALQGPPQQLAAVTVPEAGAEARLPRLPLRAVAVLSGEGVAAQQLQDGEGEAAGEGADNSCELPATTTTNGMAEAAPSAAGVVGCAASSRAPSPHIAGPPPPPPRREPGVTDSREDRPGALGGALPAAAAADTHPGHHHNQESSTQPQLILPPPSSLLQHLHSSDLEPPQQDEEFGGYIGLAIPVAGGAAIRTSRGLSLSDQCGGGVTAGGRRGPLLRAVKETADRIAPTMHSAGAPADVTPLQPTAPQHCCLQLLLCNAANPDNTRVAPQHFRCLEAALQLLTRSDGPSPALLRVHGPEPHPRAVATDASLLRLPPDLQRGYHLQLQAAATGTGAGSTVRPGSHGAAGGGGAGAGPHGAVAAAGRCVGSAHVNGGGVGGSAVTGHRVGGGGGGVASAVGLRTGVAGSGAGGTGSGAGSGTAGAGAEQLCTTYSLVCRPPVAAAAKALSGAAGGGAEVAAGVEVEVQVQLHTCAIRGAVGLHQVGLKLMLLRRGTPQGSSSQAAAAAPAAAAAAAAAAATSTAGAGSSHMDWRAAVLLAAWLGCGLCQVAALPPSQEAAGAGLLRRMLQPAELLLPLLPQQQPGGPLPAAGAAVEPGPHGVQPRMPQPQQGLQTNHEDSPQAVSGAQEREQPASSSFPADHAELAAAALRLPQQHSERPPSELDQQPLLTTQQPGPLPPWLEQQQQQQPHAAEALGHPGGPVAALRQQEEAAATGAAMTPGAQQPSPGAPQAPSEPEAGLTEVPLATDASSLPGGDRGVAAVGGSGSAAGAAAAGCSQGAATGGEAHPDPCLGSGGVAAAADCAVAMIPGTEDTEDFVPATAPDADESLQRLLASPGGYAAAAAAEDDDDADDNGIAALGGDGDGAVAASPPHAAAAAAAAPVGASPSQAAALGTSPPPPTTTHGNTTTATGRAAHTKTNNTQEIASQEAAPADSCNTAAAEGCHREVTCGNSGRDGVPDTALDAAPAAADVATIGDDVPPAVLAGDPEPAAADAPGAAAVRARQQALRMDPLLLCTAEEFGLLPELVPLLERLPARTDLPEG